MSLEVQLFTEMPMKNLVFTCSEKVGVFAVEAKVDQWHQGSYFPMKRSAFFAGEQLSIGISKINRLCATRMEEKKPNWRTMISNSQRNPRSCWFLYMVIQNGLPKLDFLRRKNIPSLINAVPAWNEESNHHIMITSPVIDVFGNWLHWSSVEDVVLIVAWSASFSGSKAAD